MKLSLIILTLFIIATLSSCGGLPEKDKVQSITTLKKALEDTVKENETVLKIDLTSRQKLLNEIKEIHPELSLTIDTVSVFRLTDKALSKFLDSSQLVKPSIKIGNRTFLEFKTQISCDSAFHQLKDLAVNFDAPRNLTTQEHISILPKEGIVYLKLDKFLGFNRLSCRFTTRSYQDVKTDLEKYKYTFENLDFFIVKCGATGKLFE